MEPHRAGAALRSVYTGHRPDRPLILRVRLKRIDGPWDLSNFEMLPSIALAIKMDREELGIRSIEFDRSRDVVLIVVGNSTSESKAPFALYSWDGNREGSRPALLGCPIPQADEGGRRDPWRGRWPRSNGVRR